jgi:thiosulfate reductase cytochrome b subunit
LFLRGPFLNLRGKQRLAYPWDAHPARGVHCTDCHFPRNSPARADLARRLGPQHLTRDPRTLALAEYLRRPDHRFATASCASCHDPAPAHRTLPYPSRHLATLSCQACHVQTLHGPALEWQDRTVVTPQGGPRLALRGVDARHGEVPSTWYCEGYSPVLLHETRGGTSRLGPFNPVTTWQWVGADQKPVADDLVRRAWLAGDGRYHPEIVSALDRNRDGALAPDELVLDTDSKVALLRARLEALGVAAPRIAGRIDLHPVRHGVVAGKWVARECVSCHGTSPRLNAPVELARGPWPGGVVPALAGADVTLLGGRVITRDGDTLRLAGTAEPRGHYVLGHSRRPWSDTLGFAIFLLSALGVALHGGARWIAARRRPRRAGAPALARVYMYGAAERLWHWTMALSVLLLLATGLSIHYSQRSPLGMPTAVFLHNVAAVVLLVTAFLSVVAHLASGEVRQFIPRGAGLPRRLALQVQFYLKGIFVGASHPFTKRREEKLNPLQQLTYAGLLNLLLPFQLLTGVLLWVAGTLP